MAKYKVHYFLNRTRRLVEGETTSHSNPAIDTELLKRSKVVTIVRDDEGESHPDNAGKFFLHRIVK